VPLYLHPAPPPKPVDETYFSGLEPDLARMLSIVGWGWHAEQRLHTFRLIAAGVFERFPTLQIIIGHMGEMIPFFLARIDAVLSGVARLKRRVADYFHSNIHITTSGLFTAPPFFCALAVVGAGRILFSVDYLSARTSRDGVSSTLFLFPRPIPKRSVTGTRKHCQGCKVGLPIADQLYGPKPMNKSWRSLTRTLSSSIAGRSQS
jgi:hypothetical protein